MLHSAHFVDVLPGSMNIDPEAAAAAVTPATKSVMAVHCAGMGSAMGRLAAIAEAHGIALIEDAAQGRGATHGGRPLGAFARLAALSVHETKNAGCGKGGAPIVNDPALRGRTEVLRDKGRNRKAFRAVASDKHTWVDIWSSSTVSGLTAAYLLGQIEMLGPSTARRRAIHARYRDGLADVAERGRIALPPDPAGSGHNGHHVHVLPSPSGEREAQMAFLRARPILAVFHDVPRHTAPFALRRSGPPPRPKMTDAEVNRAVRDLIGA